MVRHGVFEKVEPEERKLSEDLPFVRNSTPQNMIEGRDTVRRDEEELIVRESIDVADLASRGKWEGAEVGLEKSFWHHVDGTTCLDMRRG